MDVIRKTTKVGSMQMLPPKPDVCQKCAVDHDPDLPHNQQSLYWQYWFYGKHGRWPTWDDAVAHCSDDMFAKWQTQLVKHGIAIKQGGVACPGVGSE